MDLKTAGDRFAQNEYLDMRVYQELARIETVPEFRRILEQLIQHERSDYEFWLPYASKKDHTLPFYTLPLVRLMRKALGLTFTAKYLERNERQAVLNYTEVLQGADDKLRHKIQSILEHEERHEQAMISQIKEEKIAFIGSIVLGLNDALIELSGALVGFAFAFRQTGMTAAMGFITGSAASLSMASSSFMQASTEESKDPRKAAVYTGASYLGVVGLLILPFIVLSNVYAALGAMFALILAIIWGMSYYTSVVFGRDLRRQAATMLTASLGVAAVTFLIGLAVRRITGIGL